MPSIKVYVNEEQDNILSKHGNQLIRKELMKPPFNSYKMGKYIVKQFLDTLKEQKLNINKTFIPVPTLDVTDKLKGIIKETEEGSNIISHEDLDHINREKLHEIYGKIR